VLVAAEDGQAVPARGARAVADAEGAPLPLFVDLLDELHGVFLSRPESGREFCIAAGFPSTGYDQPLAKALPALRLTCSPT
jgi:hypothetical protein